MSKIFWSVELEANGYGDDLFCGTLEQCCNHIRENNYKYGEYQIAHLDTKNDDVFCLDVICDIDKL